MGKLEGKTAIVTGAASGLGEATARRFAQEGARVLLTDISDEGAAVARDIGGDAQFLPQDVANEARWAEVVGHAEQNWGRLDVLVNNAGISMRSEEHTSELPSLMRNPYAVFCLKKKQLQYI